MTLLFEVRSVTVLEGPCTRQFRAHGKAASGFQCGFYVSVLISTAYNTASLGTGEAKKNQEFCARHHSMWCQQVRKDEGSPETKYTTEVFAGMNLLCWAKVTIATSLHQVVLRADFCPLKSMWELGTAVSSMLLLQHKLGDTSEAKQLAQTWNSP